MRRSAALQAMWLTYRHWDAWKNSKNPGSRGLAIKAKTFGLIAYDRIMTMHREGL